MIENFQDAVAISRVFGPPDLFTTFTYNPKWPEVTEALCSEPGPMCSTRVVLPVRVYHMKLNDYIHDIKSGEAFGPVVAGKTCFAIPLISFCLLFSTSARDIFYPFVHSTAHCGVPEKRASSCPYPDLA